MELSLDPGFIEDVEKFVSDKPNADHAIEQLQHRYQQLKSAENQILSDRQRLNAKESDLKKAAACVDMLIEKKEAGQDAVVDYSLAANMFAKAKVPPATHVQLWLGADVMLEYPLEEAKEVLASNLTRCQENLATNKAQWAKVRDCSTTIEVNIARIYNYDVEKRKKEKSSKA